MRRLIVFALFLGCVRGELDWPPTLELVPDELSFDSGGKLTASAVLKNRGTHEADWTASSPAWLSCSPSSGTLAGSSEVALTLTLTADPTTFEPGVYSGTLEVNAPGAFGDPRAAVSLTAATPGSSNLVYYTSFIDGSLQPYGLYVPNPCDAGVSRPVAFYGHGYGGRASSGFSPYAKSFVDSNGWLLVNLEGRGNSFYDGAGQTDFFEVLSDLSSRFNVDRTRLYFEGLSMGATGAYRLAARHADLFAAAAGCDGWTDYRLFSAHYYGPDSDRWEVHPARVIACEAASALYCAENLRHTPLYVSTDLADASVWPENGLKLAQKLSNLGIQHTSETGPGGHCALYSLENYYPFFASLPPKDDAPAEVRVRTNQLKYGRAFWARILRFQRWGAFGELQATASEGRVDVTVENVERYSMDFSEAPVGASGTVEVYTNGSLSYSGAKPGGELAIYATFDQEGALVGTGVYNEPASPPLEKAPDLEGPINHALCSAWVAVYGDSSDRAEAEHFVQRWNDWYGGSAEAIPEGSLGASEMEEKNVVLFGTADSSTLTGQIQSALGFTLDLRADGVTFGSNEYGADHGLFMVYPNPLADGRYVILSHLRIDDDFSTPEAWPWFWPDYVVFDTTAPMREVYRDEMTDTWPYIADAWVGVEAGYFDRNWQLRNDPLDPRTEVSVSLDKAGYTTSDAAAVVTANVTDENASGVTGLSAGAFVLYLDGSTRPATFGGVGGGDYTASLDITGLDAAGYVVKVLVRRANSWGMGLVRMAIE